MSGRDPWENQRAISPDTRSQNPFSGANLPFTLLTLVGLAALVSFMWLADPFAAQTVAGGASTTTLPPAQTSAPGGDTAPSTTAAGSTTADPGDGSAGTTDPGGPSDLPELQGLALETVATGISFPVFAVSLPGDSRIWVLERGGRVRIIDDGVLQPDPFIDLTDRVGSGGIENGLLGMAFHPDYAQNGRFFLYYTDLELDSRLSEFSSGGISAASASGASEKILFEVDQEGIRHRGGMLEFGPDGHLWIAMGDGGLGDDSAQNTNLMQGNIHRIDVDSDDPYGIPADNPFADGAEGRPEIWAHGLRNPWRFDIDDESRLIYIADVGQATWEEINIVSIDTPGLDFGWPNFEGTQCYTPSDGCGMVGWVEPVLQYDHGSGCSITGGYVYRGSAIPELDGHYFYGDWCNGNIWSLRFEDGQVGDERDWSADLEGSGLVASFGVDGNGELLVVDSNGSIFRIVPVR